MGNTLRRLIAKIVVQRHTHIANQLKPLQVGFGIKGGCEAAAHALRIYCQNHIQAEKAVLKVDLTNAFNNISREVILEQSSLLIPSAHSFVVSSYAQSSVLRYGDNHFWSSVGVQQGDPLGPLLFCLVLKKLVDTLPVDGIDYQTWYLDDGTICGNISAVQRVFEAIKESGPGIGLTLNETKTEVCYLHSGASSSSTNFGNAKIITPEDLTLLGATFGSEQAMESAIAKLASDVSIFCKNLEDVGAHQCFFLLKNCLLIPKMLYLMRSSPIFKMQDSLRSLENCFKDALCKVLNLNFTERQWNQSVLPAKLGGLGIRSPSDLSLPAFLASVTSNTDLINLMLKCNTLQDIMYDEAVQSWRQQTNEELPNSHRQSDYDLPLAQKKLSNLRQGCGSCDAVRLSTITGQGRGAEWLNAFPISSCGLLLTNNELRINVGIRLGLEIVEPHVCKGCGTQVNRKGTHGLSCKKSSGRFPRHKECNDILCRAMISAGLPSTLEPPGLLRDDQKRPDGMTLTGWERGKAVVWDYTCVDSLAPSRVETGCITAADEAERRKTAKYTEIQQRHIFRPVACCTLGTWGEQSLIFLKEIGKRIATVVDDPRAGYFLRQRLSIALARGNCRSIMGTFGFQDGIYQWQ